MVVLGGVVIGVLVLGYGVHRLLRWAERRGYVYYREKPQRRPPPLGFLAEIYKPEMEYVVEEETSQFVRGEEDESGHGDNGDPAT